jgi:hypothetical protein
MVADGIVVMLVQPAAEVLAGFELYANGELQIVIWFVKG